MKLFKRIIALSLITIIVFYSVLFYVNKYILSSDNIKISSKHIETKKTKSPIDIYIPNFASSIKVSSDGSYVAYEQNNVLNIVDIQSGTNTKVKLNQNLSFFNWLPDRNRILIVKSTVLKNKKTFKLDYYDADRAEEGNICDFSSTDKTTEINDVKVSTLTNSIFIKTENSSRKAQIYYMNIMKKLKKLRLKSKNIGSIEAIQHQSHMVYEDRLKSRIYITNSTAPLLLNKVKTIKLLGVDDSDNIYVGEIKDNEIIGIYSGTIDPKGISWVAHELSVPVNKSDIYITGLGGIYINNSIENNLYEINSKQTFGYKGELLQVIDGSIVSNNDGKLILTPINNSITK